MAAAGWLTARRMARSSSRGPRRCWGHWRRPTKPAVRGPPWLRQVIEGAARSGCQVRRRRGPAFRQLDLPSRHCSGESRRRDETCGPSQGGGAHSRATHWGIGEIPPPSGSSGCQGRGAAAPGPASVLRRGAAVRGSTSALRSLAHHQGRHLRAATAARNRHRPCGTGSGTGDRMELLQGFRSLAQGCPPELVGIPRA